MLFRSKGSKNRLPAILQPLVPVVGAQAASKIAELPPDSQAAILDDELLGVADSAEVAENEPEAESPTAAATEALDETEAPAQEQAPAPTAPEQPAPEKVDTADEPQIIDLNKL